jgi:hypothetical protein
MCKTLHVVLDDCKRFICSSHTCRQKDCHEVADKYVEYDNVLVVLDLILHRVGAYRHVLFNSSRASAASLARVTCVC